MFRGPHSPELRAEVLAYVASGHGIRQAARQFNLDPGLVSRWVQAGVAPVATLKAESDVELVLRYFRTGIRALIVQAEVFSDPEYCRAQTAHDLAIAHGVLGDKLAGFAATAQALGFVGGGAPALLEHAEAADAAPDPSTDSF